MPKQFTEESASYFVFSIETKKGIARGGLGALITEMVGAGIGLRGLSTFVAGGRTRVFCVPSDDNLFRSFIRKRGIRARQRTAIIITGDDRQALGALNKWAISGEIPPSLIYSGSGKALVYRSV